MTRDEFPEPPWDDPLDVEAEYAAIPASATIKGMFMSPMVAEAGARGTTLPGARERYLPFSDYPLVEHARLLVEAARVLFPEVSLRQGLRKIGRASPRAIAETTLGKVMWTTVEDVPSALELASKAYAITAPSTRLTVLESGRGRARVRLHGAHCFRDSNHVGNFEGLLRACQVTGRVAVRVEGPSVAEFLLEWATPSRSSRPPLPGDKGDPQDA